MRAHIVLGLALVIVGLATTMAPYASQSAEGSMDTITLAKTIAPSGTLRAAINLGNPVLAGRDANGGPAGITVDIARELARRLNIPVDLVSFNQAGEVADAASSGRWDIAFLAIDPKRAEQIVFTAPYVLIEGAYAVPAASAIKTVDDVDRDGVRIAVVGKSAYDLFLTRSLKHATLERAPQNDATLEIFRTQRLDVLAGVRQPLAAYVADHADMRMIPGRFMAIEQAMGLPKAHAAAADDLKRFVEDLKASGFVEQALKRHNQPDAQVAPAAAR